jgi:hypothetical protein
VEGAVVGARVVADAGEDGPKDAASQGEGEYEAVVNPVHHGVAGFARVRGGDYLPQQRCPGDRSARPAAWRFGSR